MKKLTNEAIALKNGKIGIVLTKKSGDRFIASIDAEDYQLVSGYGWYAREQPMRKTRYAIAARSGTSTRISMHRLIMGIHSDHQIDHRDMDGLNNCRYNLRPATRAENMRNQTIRMDNTSGYKGVSWSRFAGKWLAFINIGKTRINLGYHCLIEDAVRARASGESKHFGEFNPIKKHKGEYCLPLVDNR